MLHKFPYRWRISDGYPAAGIEYHGCKVFGTFICGGGSTMGYKLAGYHHLGGVEIDPNIAEAYRVNHHPAFLFQEDLRLFNKKQDLPAELYNLDILDGSPPCSSFSMAGNREDDWGKEKVFREGQSLQRLDDLFFDYIELAGLLKAKVVMAENVKGLISGNARAYVKEIIEAFRRHGYEVQIFLLNAASMGVPQKRERVFFIARRADLDLPDLTLSFNEPSILFGAVEDQVENAIGKPITPLMAEFWHKVKPGEQLSKAHPKGHHFTSFKVSRYQVMNTIAANQGARYIHYRHPNKLHPDCLRLCGSFPEDYNFLNIDPQYLIGMSVPPVMMAQISHQVFLQWLKHLN